jgi:hypothetical protein
MLLPEHGCTCISRLWQMLTQWCFALVQVPVDLSAGWRPVRSDGLPAVFTGGWVGYTGYDTVRYVYSGLCA